MPVTGYDKLINEVNQMLNTDKIMVSAMNSVLVEQRKRIFQDGKAADGSKIGQYSTEPASIARSRQSRNTGRTYFPGGYRQYKSLTGKGASTVNLRDSDQMMMDLGVHILGRGEYGIGFTNAFNKQKSEWNETHFNKDIFSTSDHEDNTCLNVMSFELNKID